MNFDIEREWFEKRAAQEADLEIGAGRRRKTMTINLTTEEIAELERLANPSAALIRAAAFEEAAQVAYRVCAETRHVTLGDKAAEAIRALSKTPPPQPNLAGEPDALELRYREGFEDGEKHAADELALAQSYRDTYKGILDELQARGLTPGTIDIVKERRRQIETEGWTPAHDDTHTDGSMALAAGSYCESAARPKLLARKPGAAFAIPKLWPQSWSRDWWKPKSPREDLVRAGALILAEIERIDRVSASEATKHG